MGEADHDSGARTTSGGPGDGTRAVFGMSIERNITRAGVDLARICALITVGLARPSGTAVRLLSLCSSGEDVVVLASAGGRACSAGPLDTLAVIDTPIVAALRHGGVVTTVIGDGEPPPPALARFLTAAGVPVSGPVAVASIAVDGTVIGFLWLTTAPDEPPFDESECRRIATLADAIAVPVGYRRERLLRQQAERAQIALGEIGDRLPLASLDELLQFAVEHVCTGADADWACVFTLHADQTVRALFRAGRAVDGQESTGIVLDALAHEVLESASVRSWVGAPDEATGFATAVVGTGAVMVAKLRSGSGPYGFIVAGRLGVRRFSVSDEHFVGAAGHLLNKVIIARSLVDRLRHEAATDDLTGLANRSEMRRRLSTVVDLAAATGQPAALLLADLDDFKVVNDSLGHAAGDHVLRVIAQRMRAHVRPEDLVARLGGDEFAVLCAGVSEIGAVALADRMLRALRAPVEIGANHIVPRVSIGVAVLDPAMHSPTDQELLMQADLAMYRAKASGRDRIAVYDVALHEEIQRQLDLEQGLRDALVDGELFLEYQPILRPDGVVVSFEALVRWQHAVLGRLDPDQFIPVAEGSTLIGDVDAWVLDAVAHQVVEWRGRGLLADGVTVAINVSARDLMGPEFVERVRDRLTALRCEPSWLVAEVTESLLTDATGAASLRSLRSLGVAIALDDYGTGYSCLAQLKRVPVDVVKIDRVFVAGLTIDSVDAAIVASTVNLAHALGKHVIAEGVETIDQHRLLRAMGCDSMQGNLYARPMRPTEITDRLLANGGAGWRIEFQGSRERR